jgi:MarR family transcriptional regulator for hemolysin
VTHPATLQRDFGARLVPLARLYRRYLDRGLADLSLSHSTALAVMVLGRMGDGVRQGALADELGVEGPTVVPLLDHMERTGLVERRVDASDKRARSLHLTDAGRALARQAEERSVTIRRAVFDAVPDADLATALRVLDQVRTALSTTGGEDVA